MGEQPIDSDNSKFISLVSLICEPVRAKMLWKLLDGKSISASALALEAGISNTSASNHLSKLLEANILKVESIGRNRYFTFAREEVAYVVESLANLSNSQVDRINMGGMIPRNQFKPIQYCRTCYDHLAGYIGVNITHALVHKGILIKTEYSYEITDYGWIWLKDFGIQKIDLLKHKRAITRQCIDWTEKRPHLSGLLGALILKKSLEKDWFRKVQFSRELMVTSLGLKEIEDLCKI